MKIMRERPVKLASQAQVVEQPTAASGTGAPGANTQAQLSARFAGLHCIRHRGLRERLANHRYLLRGVQADPAHPRPAAADRVDGSLRASIESENAHPSLVPGPGDGSRGLVGRQAQLGVWPHDEDHGRRLQGNAKFVDQCPGRRCSRPACAETVDLPNVGADAIGGSSTPGH